MKSRFGMYLVLTVSACLLIVTGCDLGTYNKRLRSPGAPKQPAGAQPDDSGATDNASIKILVDDSVV